MFPEEWTGRCGLIPWPPRSPDLTPLDFLLLGYTEDAIYVPSLATTLPELAWRIRDIMDTVILAFLNNMATHRVI
jgi:hypothetical protein